MKETTLKFIHQVPYFLVIYGCWSFIVIYVILIINYNNHFWVVVSLNIGISVGRIYILWPDNFIHTTYIHYLNYQINKTLQQSVRKPLTLSRTQTKRNISDWNTTLQFILCSIILASEPWGTREPSSHCQKRHQKSLLKQPINILFNF